MEIPLEQDAFSLLFLSFSPAGWEVREWKAKQEEGEVKEGKKLIKKKRINKNQKAGTPTSNQIMVDED